MFQMLKDDTTIEGLILCTSWCVWNLSSLQIRIRDVACTNLRREIDAQFYHDLSYSVQANGGIVPQNRLPQIIILCSLNSWHSTANEPWTKYV
jgi:hypothetical protein